MSGAERPHNWRDIIWRAWRNSDDEEFARRLFDLVADEPVGWGTRVGMVFLGILYGGVVGQLVALMAWGRMSGGMGKEKVLLVAVGAIAGGGVTIWMLLILGRRLSWREWIGRLVPELAPSLPSLRGKQFNTLVGALTVGLVSGPIGGLIVGLCGRIVSREGEGKGFPMAKAPGLGFLGGLVGGMVTLAIMILSTPWAGLLLLAIVLLFGQILGLFVGLDLGLIGGLLFGSAGGLFGGALVAVVAGPAVGLGYGLIVLLVNGLVGLVRPSRHIWKWRPRRFRWDRPCHSELEAALQQMCQEHPGARKGWPSLLHDLARKKREPGPPDALIKALSSRHWRARFIARHTLVALGGEAVEPLQALAEQRGPFRGTAVWLLESIASYTTVRFGPPHASQLLCVNCLLRCTARPIRLRGPDLTYYGCRSCGRSRDLQEWSGEVVAVLDEGMRPKLIEQGVAMRVNWLRHRSLFDFDRVEVVQASDAEVERFALQVGNDTDPVRWPRYREMPCSIAAGCALSENTVRVLASLFGPIRRVD